METRLPQKIFACLLTLFVPLAGCDRVWDRVPDCDSKEAQELMQITVYTLVNNALRAAGPSDGADDDHEPLAFQISDRHQAMIDMYHPHLAIFADRRWLRARLTAQAPDLFKGDHFGAYLMRQDYEVVRQAVSVKLTQHEPLPDRVEGERTYRKVCRAKLSIHPVASASNAFAPINLTFSVNAAPRSSKRSSASPLYVPVNFFEATESPLPFALSDSEKVALMALGAVKDIQAVRRHQSPVTTVTKRALRAFRAHLENNGLPAGDPLHQSIEGASPDKLGAPHVKR